MRASTDVRAPPRSGPPARHGQNDAPRATELLTAERALASRCSTRSPPRLVSTTRPTNSDPATIRTTADAPALTAPRSAHPSESSPAARWAPHRRLVVLARCVRAPPDRANRDNEPSRAEAQATAAESIGTPPRGGVFAKLVTDTKGQAGRHGRVGRRGCRKLGARRRVC